jgi:hypothetical protein
VFVGFSDVDNDDDMNGLVDGVAITANVNATVAGQYQFGITLEAANGAQIKGSTTVALESGVTPVTISFGVADLRRLGADGPYALKDAILVYRDDPEGPATDFRESAGSTAAYLRSLLDLGEVPDSGPDVTLPVIGQLADIVAEFSSAAGAVVTFDLPDVTDDIDFAPNVAAKPASGSLFPQGTTTVAVTATDAAGNSSVGTFTVTVHSPTLSALQVTRGGFVRDRRTGTYAQQLTLTNTSAGAVPGPVFVALDALGANSSLANASGTTSIFMPVGSPYILVPGSSGSLAAGASLTVVLQFSNAANTAIT